jgi:hypothetical protein
MTHETEIKVIEMSRCRCFDVVWVGTLRELLVNLHDFLHQFDGTLQQSSSLFWISPPRARLIAQCEIVRIDGEVARRSLLRGKTHRHFQQFNPTLHQDVPAPWQED